MKGKESPQTSFTQKAEKAAELLGEGRMSRDEKRSYLEKHQQNFFRNVDFVSVGTYLSLFNELHLEGKTMVNVGAGYAFAPGYRDVVSPVIEALGRLNPHATLIPVDNKKVRSESWLLLETTEKSKNNNIHLEPVAADAISLPFQNNSLDGYLSNNLINEPRAEETELSFVSNMFAEAYRVLKPGGFLIVSSFGYFWWKLKNGEFIYNDGIDLDEIIEKTKVAELLGRTGFSSVREIALDDSEIQTTVDEKLKRRMTQKGDVLKAGVREACAFLAIK